MEAIHQTPMMKQYYSIKADYPDAFLFYRLGDFYELFFEDAQIVARELELTLTSKNGKQAEHPIRCVVSPITRPPSISSN